MLKDLPQGETQYETDREVIFALAGEPVAYMNPYGGVLAALSTGLEKATFNICLYTADQVIAARKPLAEEVGQLKAQYQDAVSGLQTMGNQRDELRQQLAEKDAEIERKQSMFDAINADFSKLEDKLAAAQADNERLRKALTELDEAARCVQAGEWDKHSLNPERIKAKEAIAKPSDTSALEAMIARAGEVMRSKSATIAESHAWEYDTVAAIRALPGVTLADIPR